MTRYNDDLPWAATKEQEAAARVALEVLQSAGLRDARAVAALARAVIESGASAGTLGAFAPRERRVWGHDGRAIVHVDRGPGTWEIRLVEPDSGKLMRGEP